MPRTTKKVEVVERPYVLTFHATGTSYPLTSEEARRLIQEYPLVSATKNKVVLRGDDGHNSTISAATLGGGPAFNISK